MLEFDLIGFVTCTRILVSVERQGSRRVLDLFFRYFRSFCAKRPPKHGFSQNLSLSLDS